MTACDVLLEHLVDGSALPPDLATHLAGCAACQRLTQLTGAARSPAPAAVDPGFEVRTVAGAGAALARRRRTRIALGTSAGAAAAALALWLAIPTRPPATPAPMALATTAAGSAGAAGSGSAPATPVVAPPPPISAAQLPAALVQFARATERRRPLRDPSFLRAAAPLTPYSALLLRKGTTP